MQVDAPNTRAHATRDKILEAAERIFARNGYRAMTMRAVTDDAGVNLAAVNYHFGSKKALVHEVIRARFEPINRQRLEQLEAARSKHAPVAIPLREILDILYRPIFEATLRESVGREAFNQLIGRVLSEPAEFINEFHRKHFTILLKCVRHELERTLPELPESELQYRLFFVTSLMIGIAIHPERLETVPGGTIDPNDHESVLTRALDFACAGLASPPAANP